MEYQVSNDIPIPPRTSAGRAAKYSFPALRQGESFVVTSRKEVQSARKFYNKKGQKVSVRSYAVNRKQTFRIWRIM